MHSNVFDCVNCTLPTLLDTIVLPSAGLEQLVILNVLYIQKKCEVYWPENADEAFIPAPGSPLTIKYKSMLPFAEFVIRKMVATHVSTSPKFIA